MENSETCHLQKSCGFYFSLFSSLKSPCSEASDPSVMRRLILGCNTNTNHKKASMKVVVRFAQAGLQFIITHV
jgi:hypothetical protein